MTIIEPLEFDIVEEPGEERRRQINTLLAIATAGLMMALGLLMRSNNLNSTYQYNDEQNGIYAQLPTGWLLNTTNEAYIFQVEDPAARPFKTRIIVGVQAVGQDASPRNIADLISTQGQELTAFRELSRQETSLGEDQAFQIDYTYVDTEANPFLETEPITIRGVDVIVLRGNQAVIFTFRDAEQSFDRNYYHFARFLATVEY